MSEELGQRAIACKGWRWMPGMKVAGDGRLWRGWTGGLAMTGLIEGTEWLANVGELPDISDPCTLGGLLALVREAWVGWLVDAEHLAPDVYRVRVHDIDDTAARAFRGPTLGDVLVAALECAP